MLGAWAGRTLRSAVVVAGALVTMALLLGSLSSPAGAYLYSSRDGALARWTQDGRVVQEGFIQKQTTGAVAVGDHVYWLNRSGSAIGRANLDGSAPNDVFIPLPSGTILPGSRVAVSGSYLYWTAPNAVGRADLGAQSANPSWLPLPANPVGVAVGGGHIYWDVSLAPNTGPCTASSGCEWVGRAVVDGSQPENTLIDAGASNQLAGLAADATHLYVAIANQAVGYSGVATANLDGTSWDPTYAVNDSAANSNDYFPAGDVAVDSGHLYWDEQGCGRVSGGLGCLGRAALDGSGVDTDFALIGLGSGVTADANGSNLDGTASSLYQDTTDPSGAPGYQQFTDHPLPGGVSATSAWTVGDDSAAVGSDHALYWWEAPHQDASGYGTPADGYTPPGLTPTAFPQQVAIPGGAGIAAVSGTVALGTDGTVYAWGPDPGDTTTVTAPRVLAVALPAGLRATAVSGDCDVRYAIGSDGQLYGWGNNIGGASSGDPVGDGSTTPVLAPEQISLPGGVLATSVSNSCDATEVLGSDGNVYGWGDNGYGQVGNGSTSPVLAPVKITLPGAAQATAVVSCRNTSFAVDTHGNLYGWGDNSLGQVGTGSTTATQYLTPEPVALPGGAHVTRLGCFSVAADDGHFYRWGYGRPNTQPWYLPTAAVTTPEAVAVPSNVSFNGPQSGYVNPGGSGYTDHIAGYIATPSGTPPRFTTAAPPASVLVGTHMSYQFTASGSPAPAYALSGAPAWLSIDPSTGTLAGDVPHGISSFSYSVTATNSAGTATAGPFSVQVQSTATVSGSVSSGRDGSALSNVGVDACPTDGSACTHTITGADGSFSFTLPIGAGVVLSAYAPPGSSLDDKASSVIQVGAAGVSGIALVLPAHAEPSFDVTGTVLSLADGSGLAGASVSACAGDNTCWSTKTGADGGFKLNIPPGTQVTITVYPPYNSWLRQVATAAMTVPETGIGGLRILLPLTSVPQGVGLSGTVGNAQGSPIVNWGSSFGVSVTGCAGGVATASIVAVPLDEPLTQAQAVTILLSEDPDHPGSYSGSFAPLAPLHGPAELKTDVSCPDAGFAYPGNGPAGTTVTVGGAGFSGATSVTFGGVPAAGFNVLDDGVIQATAPAGHGTVPIVVHTAGGATTVGQYGYGQSVGGADRHGRAAPHARVPASIRTATLTAIRDQAIKQTINLLLHDSDAYDKLTRAVHDTAAAINPSCENVTQVIKDQIRLALEPEVIAVAAELTPEAMATVALAFSETGPADLLITAVTPWAVKWAVGKVADGLVNAAVDAIFWHCKPTPNMLIDPSGNVLDTNGNPVSGATVTILRSDTAGGPFAAVDPTEPGIEPALNPETTGADGVFHWDVRPGFYDLQGSAPGCAAPGSANPFTTLGPLPVPPPQVGLVLTLSCPNEAPAPVPAITRLTEGSGAPAGGTQLRLLGSGFTPASTVSFGAGAATGVKFISPTALEATSPPGSGTVDVRVHNGDNASGVTAADRFAYATAPAVAKLGRTRGTPAGGSRLTISGSGFTGATAVGFGGKPGTHLTVLSDGKLTVRTPAHIAGRVDVQVVGPAGVSPLTGADRYTFAPSLTAGHARLTVKRGIATLALVLRAAAGTPALTQVAVQLPAGLTLAKLKSLRKAAQLQAGRHVRVKLAEQARGRLLVASLRPATRAFQLTLKRGALRTGARLRARSRHHQVLLGFTARLALSNRERSTLLLGAR